MGLSSLCPLSSIEMYFSLVPNMDAALTWLTFAARLAATSSEASSGLLISCGCISARYASLATALGRLATSLSLFPPPPGLSAYSAVSRSHATLCLAISCSALFACRSPPC